MGAVVAVVDVAVVWLLFGFVCCVVASNTVGGHADSPDSPKNQKKQHTDPFSQLFLFQIAGKGRKAEISEAEEKDRELFEAAFNTMQEGRKTNFEKLLDSYNHMELSLEKDEELLRKREEQENKFAEADSNEDDRLLREGEQAQDGFGKDGKLIMPEDHAMGKLEDWLKTLSSKEIHMLKKLGKKSAGSHIEKEMHVAATRKQKREEASWYACQFKLTAPSASCMDFHSVFAGTLDKHQTEGLNEEEHMRVCNSVEAQLSKIPHVPAYKTETEAGKAKYLAWCVNNIHQ